MRRRRPDAQIVFVGEKDGRFTHLIDSESAIDDFVEVHAGKFRRYHGESWLRRLLDVKTHLLNLRDIVYIVQGLFESRRIIKQERPDIVFLKGGFVGAPLGVAAGMARVPMITHDSDAVAGLANRLVQRWATIHAVAGAPEYYPYNPAQIRVVGTIISDDYRQSVNAKTRTKYRRDIGVPAAAKVLFVTGGSSGSVAINSMMESIIAELLERYEDLYIIHQSGKGKAGVSVDEAYQERYRAVDFIDQMHKVSAAADVIVMRAGANTLAEFGAQAKACIVIPAPHLAGGHQLKNAEQLAKQNAVVVVDQAAATDDPKVLQEEIETLLRDEQQRRRYGNMLQQQTLLDANEKIVDIIEELVGGHEEAA